MDKFTLSTASMLFAALAMTACDKRDAPQPKAEPGSVAEKVERKVEEVRADSRRELTEAKEKAREVAADVRQAGAEAGDKVTDAVISTAVNAEFAKDSSLSATKIDVDTAAGRVALRGTAPSAAARDRATELAAHVKGVRSVDNQLTVEPAKM